MRAEKSRRATHAVREWSRHVLTPRKRADQACRDINCANEMIMVVGLQSEPQPERGGKNVQPNFNTATNEARNTATSLTTSARAPDESRATPAGRKNVAALPIPSKKGVFTPCRPASVRTEPVETLIARTKLFVISACGYGNARRGSCGDARL
jgi:hypothetical protein